MKKLLLTLITLICVYGFSQENQEYYITETDSIGFTLKAGSCGSPDGPTTETLITPPNYQYLVDNGYCLYSYSTTSTFTACFTFVAGSSSVDINAGHSQSCNNTSFANFTLFNSSCQQIGTGLSYTGLIPGQTYTWCLTMRAWGGPNCDGFTSFCPYFLNYTILPIKLFSFTGNLINNYNYIKWITASEMNNDFFILERSEDGNNWERIYYIDGVVNSNQKTTYTFKDYYFKDNINYYKLTQFDFDGEGEESFIISVDNRNNKYLVKMINIMGQEVDDNYTGIVIYQYSDGTFEKKYINN